MIRLIAFLGNPGREYRLTRHNMGWLVAEALPSAARLVWQDKFKGSYAIFSAAGAAFVYLLKPETFMNQSGDSAAALMRFYKIEAAELLVVHDEIELPFGSVHLRLGGGLGGHNGLRSIEKSLASREFYRFRLGVGRPARGDVSSHVLARFSADQEAVLPDYCRAAARLVEAAAGASPAEKREALIQW
jgi:PTH1 family peptidyl-tRNA hydrolase